MSRLRYRWAVLWWVLSIGAVGVVAFWAGRQVVVPPEADVAAQDEVATYVVETGSLGQSLSFTGSIQWPVRFTAASPASGVVTSVDLQSDGAIESGQLLYRVNEKPVVACPGAVPAYRDLALGDSGRDVAQLRECVGLDEGDTFDDALREALRVAGGPALGEDGTVVLGSVVFIKELPARGHLVEQISPGTVVSAGQPIVAVVGQAPETHLTVSSNAAVVPGEGMAVTGQVAGVTFEGLLGHGSSDGAGATVLPITTADGQPVCVAACAEAAPLPGPVDVPLQVELTASADGMLVPVSAIRTLPDGSTQITLTDGETSSVKVLSSVGGQAIVEGVDAGAEILLFAPAP